MNVNCLPATKLLSCGTADWGESSVLLIVLGPERICATTVGETETKGSVKVMVETVVAAFAI